MTPGSNIHGGTINTFTNTFTIGTFISNNTTFAISNDAIKPHTISGRSVKSVGPGVIFKVISRASRTAVVPDPGTPSVSIGTRAPPAAALLPASGAATPLDTPVPKPPFSPAMDFSLI